MMNWGKSFIILILLPLFSHAQIITNFAGGGSSLGDGGPATAAIIMNPAGLIFNKGGQIFICSGTGNRVRKIDNAGIISTVIGTGLGGYTGDGGAATLARIKNPVDIAIDTADNIYISDFGNNAIRKIDIVSGVITTICGDGSYGYSGDNGPATGAQLRGPNSICFDPSGNLYIADASNNVIRKINPSGIITTFAGTGVAGYTGDGSPATTAQLYLPTGVTADAAGNIYITSNGRIRKVDATGIISTYGGTGVSTYIGDGMPATAAQFGGEYIKMDLSGNLFISDRGVGNDRVYMIDNAGIFHSMAGNGVMASTGDGGPATAASLDHPTGITFDACGSLYISQINTPRIRKITYPPILTIPIISIMGDASKPVGSNVTINATVSDAGSSYVIHWMNKGVEFTTTTVPGVTYTKAAGIDTITARVVSTATYGCYDSTTSGGWVVTTSGVEVKPLTPKGGPSIWPNPFNNELYIDDVAALSSYRVVSMVGTVVLGGELHEGSNRVDVHSLPTGVYMIVVNDSEGRRSVVRVIKR